MLSARSCLRAQLHPMTCPRWWSPAVWQRPGNQSRNKQANRTVITLPLIEQQLHIQNMEHFGKPKIHEYEKWHDVKISKIIIATATIKQSAANGGRLVAGGIRLALWLNLLYTQRKFADYAGGHKAANVFMCRMGALRSEHTHTHIDIHNVANEMTLNSLGLWQEARTLNAMAIENKAKRSEGETKRNETKI